LSDREIPFDATKIKSAKKQLKKEYKQQKKDLKEIEKTGTLVGEVLTRGFLKAYVLHILSDGPLCGNEILKEIEKRTGGKWAPSPGGIYPLLRRMEKKDFVIGDWEDDNKRTRRTYTITNEGRIELDQLVTNLQPKAENTLQVFMLVIRDLFEGGDLSDVKNTSNPTVSSIKR